MTPYEERELRALRRSTMGNGQRETSNGRNPHTETAMGNRAGGDQAGSALDPETELRLRRLEQLKLPPVRCGCGCGNWA